MMVERTGWVKTEAQANSSSKTATTEVDPENVFRLTELIYPGIGWSSWPRNGLFRFVFWLLRAPLK